MTNRLGQEQVENIIKTKLDACENSQTLHVHKCRVFVQWATLILIVVWYRIGFLLELIINSETCARQRRHYIFLGRGQFFMGFITATKRVQFFLTYLFDKRDSRLAFLYVRTKNFI